MNIFCDTSVLLAASKSEQGASRALFSLSRDVGWILQTSHWVIRETERNLDKLGGEAAKSWEKLKPELYLMADVVSIDRALVFPVPKDRPVLVTALAWADVFVTLDREDFIQLLGLEQCQHPPSEPRGHERRCRSNGGSCRRRCAWLGGAMMS